MQNYGANQLYLAIATWLIPVLWFFYSYTGFHPTETVIRFLKHFSGMLILIYSLPLFWVTIKMMTKSRQQREKSRILVLISLANLALILLML